MNKITNRILHIFATMTKKIISVTDRYPVRQEKYTLAKGDTASLNGITGIYLENPMLGIVALRPIPAVTFSEEETFELGDRGLEFYSKGLTSLYHIEGYLQDMIFAGPRVVLCEKTMTHLIEKDKKKRSKKS